MSEKKLEPIDQAFNGIAYLISSMRDAGETAETAPEYLRPFFEYDFTGDGYNCTLDEYTSGAKYKKVKIESDIQKVLDNLYIFSACTRSDLPESKKLEYAMNEITCYLINGYNLKKGCTITGRMIH